MWHMLVFKKRKRKTSWQLVSCVQNDHVCMLLYVIYLSLHLSNTSNTLKLIGNKNKSEKRNSIVIWMTEYIWMKIRGIDLISIYLLNISAALEKYDLCNRIFSILYIYICPKKSDEIFQPHYFNSYRPMSSKDIQRNFLQMIFLVFQLKRWEHFHQGLYDSLIFFGKMSFSFICFRFSNATICVGTRGVPWRQSSISAWAKWRVQITRMNLCHN